MLIDFTVNDGKLPDIKEFIKATKLILQKFKILGIKPMAYTNFPISVF